MATKLYPPQIEGSLPAFYLNYDPTNSVVLGANITVPFTKNAAVGTNEIKAFVLRLRTASSNSYLFPPIYSENFNLANNTVTFGLSKTEAETLNEGQYYKVQIAYCGASTSSSYGLIETAENNIGYFSTVGIIKCTSKPSIYINGLNSSSVNFFNNEFMGVYDQSSCRDLSEKVYSYEFIVYDENDEVYYTTGEQLHQSSYDTEYNFSIDKTFINDFVSEDVTYSIQYKVTTMNNLQLSTPQYKITNTNLVPPNRPLEIVPICDEDNGYITIKFKGNIDENKSYYYIIDETKLLNEKENEVYLKDMYGNTVINIIQRLSNYSEKITFLKTHSLFKNVNEENNTFYYYWDLTSNKNNSNEENSSFNKIILVGSGREIVKNISLKYIKDNNILINEEEHYIKTGETYNYLLFYIPVEEYYYGSYILSRASDIDNYTTWFILERFRLDEQQPSTHTIKDVTIEHGRKYKYSLQQYNIWGLTSSRIYSDIFYANFEDMYLYDGEKLLKIRYNPKIDSFKTTLLEQKTDTIGGRFPFITRNGATNYKQFPIGGLIAQELDNNEMFIKRNYGLAHRHSTSAIQEDKYNLEGELIQVRDLPEGATRNFHDFTDENIFLEREFKLAVLDWLNDGNPKLFKSPYEGNYIVRLMQNSLSPINELGRLLHNFTSQAYEIAECNYDNLVKYGFINPIQPSSYTGLWKTYNLVDPNLKNSSGDIEIKFDVGLSMFTIQDMMPGDIVYVLFYDSGEWEPIMIGITGSYTYNNPERIVTKLKIHPHSEIEQTDNRNISGVIHCFYQGVRITAFDSIIDQKLMTIPGQQFIGYNPRIKIIRDMEWALGNNGFQNSLTPSDFDYLHDYQITDILQNEGNFNIGSNGITINDEEVIKILKSIEPGEILDKIKATLWDGVVDKISLINIEHAKFTARNLVPVYVVQKENNNLIPSQMTSGKVVGEEYASTNENTDSSNTIYVATTPFGHPYKIDELSEFEMIDPFCIFQVFEFDNSNKIWEPIKTEKTSCYYDPYYKTWLVQNDEYNPTIKINYHWQQITLDDTYYLNQIQSDENEYFYNNVNGEKVSLGKDLPLYTLIAESISTDGKYYYLNNLKEKVEIKYNSYTDNFYKKDGINYFISKGFATTSNNRLDIPKEDKNLYYTKIYDTIYDLSYTQEKTFTDLKDINSIVIGNGVMADLIIQIKVLDYYTEIYNDEVRKAKQEYLDSKQFYTDLMPSIALIKKSDYSISKYDALVSAYDKLLNGTNGKFLTNDNKKVIQALLNNTYEKENLNLLKLYNVESLNEYINFDLLDQLIEYKNKNIDKDKFGFNDLGIYFYKSDNDIPIYYLLNKQTDIKYTLIKDSNNKIIKSVDTICYQINPNGEEIFYFINKKFLFDEYSKNHTISYKDFKVAYQEIYDVNDFIVNADQRTVIIELNNLDLDFWTEIIGYVDNIDDLNNYKFNNNIYRINNEYYIINDLSNIQDKNNEENNLIPVYKYGTIIGYIPNINEDYIKYNNDSILYTYKIQDELYLLTSEYINTLKSFKEERIPVFKNEINTIKWQLLNDEQKQLLMNNNLFISLEEVPFDDEEIEKTPLSFYEEKELNILSDMNQKENVELEGVLTKTSNLKEETEKLDSEIKDLIDKIEQDKIEYINTLTDLNNKLDFYNNLVYKNWSYSELFKLLHFQSYEEILAYFNGYIDEIENQYSELIEKIELQSDAVGNLQNLIDSNLFKVQISEKNKTDATTSHGDLQWYLEEQIKVIRGELVFYNSLLYTAIKNILRYIFNTEDGLLFNVTNDPNVDFNKLNLYQDIVVTAIENYNKNYELITNNNILQDNYSSGVKQYLEDLNKQFKIEYDQYNNLIKNAINYLDIESLAKISNLYDDIKFLQNTITDNKESIVLTLNNFTYTLNNIALKEQDSFIDLQWEEYIDPFENFKTNIKKCTKNQIQQIMNLKDRRVFWHRRSLVKPISETADSQYYNTFIFYPLSNQLDPIIKNKDFNSEENINSNLIYYNSLTESQKISVIEISKKLNNNIMEFLNNYSISYGDGIVLATYIYNNYLAKGKDYNIDALKTLRNRILGIKADGEQDEENNDGIELNNYQNKIYKAAIALERSNENLKLGFYPFSRDWFQVYNGDELYQEINIEDNSSPKNIYYEQAYLISDEQDLSKIDENKWQDYYIKQSNFELIEDTVEDIDLKNCYYLGYQQTTNYDQNETYFRKQEYFQEITEDDDILDPTALYEHDYALATEEEYDSTKQYYKKVDNIFKPYVNGIPTEAVFNFSDTHFYQQYFIKDVRSKETIEAEGLKYQYYEKETIYEKIQENIVSELPSSQDSTSNDDTSSGNGTSSGNNGSIIENDTISEDDQPILFRPDIYYVKVPAYTQATEYQTGITYYSRQTGNGKDMDYSETPYYYEGKVYWQNHSSDSSSNNGRDSTSGISIVYDYSDWTFDGREISSSTSSKDKKNIYYTKVSSSVSANNFSKYYIQNGFTYVIAKGYPTLKNTDEAVYETEGTDKKPVFYKDFSLYTPVKLKIYEEEAEGKIYKPDMYYILGYSLITNINLINKDIFEQKAQRYKKENDDTEYYTDTENFYIKTTPFEKIDNWDNIEYRPGRYYYDGYLKCTHEDYLNRNNDDRFFEKRYNYIEVSNIDNYLLEGLYSYGYIKNITGKQLDQDYYILINQYIPCDQIFFKKQNNTIDIKDGQGYLEIPSPNGEFIRTRKYTNFEKLYIYGYQLSNDEIFLENKKYYLRQLSLAQSLLYIKDNNDLPNENNDKLTSITALSDIGNDPLTGEQIILPGLYKDYLDLLGINELELKKIILNQALLLIELYEQQIDNYTNKYNNYKKIYDEELSIYNSFNNSQIIDFYKDNSKTMEDIKKQVKQAWWKFLAILDKKYTEERERGMYI